MEILQDNSQIKTSLDDVNKNKIIEILDFIKSTAGYIDVDNIFKDLEVDLDLLTEQQIMFFITRRALDKAPVKEVYNILRKMNIFDIMTINLNEKDFDHCITVTGAFFYSKSVMRMVSKKNILEVKKVLGEDIYKDVILFGKNDCKDNYPIKPPFKDKFYSVGYHIFQIYFSRFAPILQDIVMTCRDYPLPDSDMSHLKIDYDYSREIIALVQYYIMGGE